MLYTCNVTCYFQDQNDFNILQMYWIKTFITGVRGKQSFVNVAVTLVITCAVIMNILTGRPIRQCIKHCYQRHYEVMNLN